MRINSVAIENFLAIQKLELTNLGRTIIIAGQNGAGKSCILESIRLVKSIYGGYQANEYTMWFGEHHIQIDASPDEFTRILRDKSKPMRLAIEFELAETEKAFLLGNVDALAIANAWKEIAPTRTKFASGESLATRQRLHSDAVTAKAVEEVEVLRSQLQAKTFTAEVRLRPGEKFVIAPSLVLEYAFSNFKPDQLGVIDFHGSDRRYDREQIGNVDLNAQSQGQRLQSHALYNQKDKYQQFKGQLAGQYIRELLARAAGVQSREGAALTETLQELFTTFFPGKSFRGPIPTQSGRLSFPVQTHDGKEHDIDELSSGEKEVLYGYLRLRNATPRNSVLLIDEPELHLNPRLVRGLSNFYHQHLTLPLNCQLWLITHSDTLLRDSVGRPDFSIFYIHPAHTLPEGSNQASPAQNVQASLVPLIEDLAGFNPQAKVVLLEGGGETKFDAAVIATLFPLFTESVNLVSAGSKLRLHTLRSALEEVASVTDLGADFYSISDRDSDAASSAPSGRAFAWDVYHIENYLLVPQFILQAIQALRVARIDLTLEQVESLLRQSAEQTVHALIRHIVQKEVSDLLFSTIEFRTNKTDIDVAGEVARAIAAIPPRVAEAVNANLNQANLRRRAAELEAQFRADLQSGNWTSSFQGRTVLKHFVNSAQLTVGYDVLKYAVLSEMKHAQYQPLGMSRVLNRIHAVQNHSLPDATSTR